MFIRIQTNRAKLLEVISLFDRNAVKTEILIAPRPLPKQRFRFYVAFANVIENSENHNLLQAIKNHKQITNTVFDKETSAIKYYWEAGELGR